MSSDLCLDLFDLFYSLALVEPIQEEVDIGSRAELLVVVLTERSLGGLVLIRDWEETVDDRRASSHDVGPVDVGQGSLGEDREVVAKLP